MMGRTCLSEGGPAVGSDDFDVYVLIADIRVQLFEGAQRSEDREGGGKGDESRFCHTCRDAEQVLLRDPYVVEAIGKPLHEVSYLCRFAKVGSQGDNPFVLFRQFCQGLSVNFRGCQFCTFNSCVIHSTHFIQPPFPHGPVLRPDVPQYPLWRGHICLHP